MNTKNLLMACVACLSLSLFTVLKAAVDDHVWLRVQGQHIVTSPLAENPNTPFLPVGVACQGGSGEGFARYCKDANVNCVRLAIRTHAMSWGTDTVWNMDSIVQQCRIWVDIAKQHGIYTIFDNHGYFGYNAGQIWNPARFEQWKANFVKLATEFKDEPWVIGYELMNEMYTNTVSANDLKAWLLSCATRIREVDTKHIIFIADIHYGDPFWSGTFNAADFDVLDPPQIAITPHRYPCDDSDVKSFLNGLASKRSTHNVPVFISEFSGGLMGNGLTYDWNKKWLKEFFEGAYENKFGWSVWYFRGFNNGGFEGGYAPDDPDMWIPAAQKFSTGYPVPSNGVPVGMAIDFEPSWFTGMATGQVSELTIRVVDTLGTTVTGSNASVQISVSGEGTLENIPSAVQNGIAKVTLRTTSTAGAITVTATSPGLSQAGNITIQTVASWANFAVKDSGSGKACSITGNQISKGINLNLARYEYTTDGGTSWTWWDAAQSDEFEGTSLNATKWTSENINTSGGSASVANGALTIRAEGDDVWSTWNNTWNMSPTFAKDDFYFVHEERVGDFEIVTRINSQDNTDPWALAGIMARDRAVSDQASGICGRRCEDGVMLPV